MKGYNIYYKNDCINNMPLTAEELNETINNSNKYIYKHNSILNTITQIDKSKIRIVECTIV